ncbi:hypothetical protein CEUSTIGMA_g1745.t1 [Chlamydomonas eustigma]|uniref:ABC transporter domain-containing protein n=1 Tax=Chlamydomonas eustigma TaxID=1157962 RepID=A0A250WU54_9CHLO|nr:hypothetical protein CEUSTIGMA_g1745.t1 [Chlamydomonas eustigma]|eukprot:GAX74296.1 hypothetical protein CEUSTIGMA_g1745.t1 [Chlamydomonas eustigma]
MDFFIGAALIISPAQTFPIFAAVGTLKGIQKLLTIHRSRRSKTFSNVHSVHNSSPTAVEKIPSVTLEWSNVTCILSKQGSETKTILNNIQGRALPGRLTAIMGPSGGGKTSLLNALAGQFPQSRHIDLTGTVLVNGLPRSASHHRQAYVEQEDAFYSMLTAEETLQMATQLRLPASISSPERSAYVSTLVSKLGLSKVMDTRVGSKKARGLSGGEKKRLSIGCELIGSPSLLFMDEPTTGLDAFAAQKVVCTLKDLAASGHTVLASIHQPRSSIFTLFDDLVLLSEGELLYCGEACEAAQYFSSLGRTCPAGYSPADFLADLIAVDYSSPESEAASKETIARLVAAWKSRSEAVSLLPGQKAGGWISAPLDSSAENAGISSGLNGTRVGWLTQLRLLALRSWRQVIRDKPTNMARVIANVTSALIFGSIFFRMKKYQSSIQDRLGLLQVAAINTAMSSLVKTLSAFPRERVIVARERAKDSYSTAPYLTAKLAAELPIGAIFPLLFGLLTYPLCGLHPKPGRLLKYLGILTLESFTSSALGLAVGAMATSTEAASAIGPAVMVIWIVFGGYYVNQDNVPRLLRWLPSASLIKQGFQALCINEFPGLEFQPDVSGRGMTDGHQVLTWLSFDNTSVADCVLKQIRILAFYYWATFCILKAGRDSYQPMRPSVVQL